MKTLFTVYKTFNLAILCFFLCVLAMLAASSKDSMLIACVLVCGNYLHICLWEYAPLNHNVQPKYHEHGVNGSP